MDESPQQENEQDVSQTDFPRVDAVPQPVSLPPDTPNRIIPHSPNADPLRTNLIQSRGSRGSSDNDRRRGLTPESGDPFSSDSRTASATSGNQNISVVVSAN